MKKFFLILGVLFAISLLVTILAGNITWQNLKDTGITVKNSFVKVSKSVSETSVKVNDSIQKKIKETREKFNKDKSQ